VAVCGGLWWFVVFCGVLWCFVVVCGGLWWFVVSRFVAVCDVLGQGGLGPKCRCGGMQLDLPLTSSMSCVVTFTTGSCVLFGRDECSAFCLLRTAVLRKIPHSNCCKIVPNRPLRGRRGRFGTLLQLLECGIFGRTAVTVALGSLLLCCAVDVLHVDVDKPYSLDGRVVPHLAVPYRPRVH